MGLRRTLGALRGVGHYCVIIVGQLKQESAVLTIDSARTEERKSDDIYHLLRRRAFFVYIAYFFLYMVSVVLLVNLLNY